jgi:GT2 family glycosyltransferase
MASRALVSVLIVSWNTREMLRDCLLSLQSHRSRAELEIIVVENASGDGSAAMVRHEFPGVELIECEKNSGYAQGNNLGYEAARGEMVWLLNPDTQVLEGALDALLDRLESEPRCGAVASALIDARDGHTQRSCRTFPWPRALWAEALGLARAFPRSKRWGFYRMGWWSYRDARPVEQPMASSLLLRRVAIEEARDNTGPLFDAQFPIFFNDVDLCWRVVRSGWRIWFEPRSRVLHWGGAATRQVRPAMIRESHRALRAFYAKQLRALLSPATYALTMGLVRCAGLARVAATRWKEQRP